MIRQLAIQLLVLLFCGSICTAAFAADKVNLDFQDVELTKLIQVISEMTGRNFIYDDKVRGKVTIISPQPMSVNEAYQVFLTVLNVKGFTVVPSGTVNKIVPASSARENTLPTMENKKHGEQYVTRLIPLQNIDAGLMASTVLTPLIPKTGNIVAYAPSNMLIITDTASNIERLMKIIAELDISSATEALEVVTLKHASATDVAQICTQVITQMSATPKRGRAARNVQTAGGKETSRIIPYERTNALIILATSDDLLTIKNLIAQLDQVPEQTRSNIKVYYLENADAETLAKTLNEILTGIVGQAPAGRAVKPGQPATPTTQPVTITADKPTNSLIINATPEDYETLQGIVAKLDVKRKQVFVEALILELSMGATTDLGLSLQGAYALDKNGEYVVGAALNRKEGDPNLITNPTSLLTNAVNGVLLGGMFNLINISDGQGGKVSVPALSALIGLSEDGSDVNVVSAPRLLATDNEEAEIIVGENVPVITERLSNGTTNVNNQLTQSVSIERKDVGLTLRFTPQITEGDQVRLNVYQEISDVSSTNENVGPTYTKRMVRNTVIAQNGQTVVLGGLIKNNIVEGEIKVPLLGDIPLLGWLFKRKTTTESKTNLLVFITPKIIKNSTDMNAVTNSSKKAMDDFQNNALSPTQTINTAPPEPRSDQ
ncbi:MAG: type II secretion system secretin GspD [Desulfuromonadaceae bacterium]|nr:type II secretion system secretin GspD [Desulfuromonadaceae bacterium]